VLDSRTSNSVLRIFRWGGVMVSPTVDAVQEMQVVNNTYDAQYRKAAGGIISLVSKSGVSEYHGTGYEFLRSANLDATTWDSNRWADPTCTTPECNKQRKGEFKRHQFGGNIGGPLWRSRRREGRVPSGRKERNRPLSSTGSPSLPTRRGNRKG